MEDLSKEAERAIYYKFLSECFYLPNKEHIEILSSYKDSIGSKYSEISGYLDSLQDFEPLMIDYSKLFVGPFELLAAPYGSVYLEESGKLMGNSTTNVEELYAQEGIKVEIKEVPDHIAIELEFMYFLANRKVEAITIMDENLIALYHQKQQSFLDIHLGSWIEEFTENVEKNAQTGFYRKLAQLTREFVLKDKEAISNKDYMSL